MEVRVIESFYKSLSGNFHRPNTLARVMESLLYFQAEIELHVKYIPKEKLKEKFLPTLTP